MLSVVFIMIILAVALPDISKADNSLEPGIIQEYVDCLNENDYYSLLNLLADPALETYYDAIMNQENKDNHIGIYNYRYANLTGCIEIFDEEEVSYYCGIDSDLNVTAYWKCYLDIATYRDSDYLYNGENIFYFVIVSDENGIEKIADVIRDSMYIPEDNTVIQATDSPISNPNFGTWSNPSTIRVKGYDDPINFKDYCKVVLVNEFGNDNYEDQARKANALAIKNFSWHFILVQHFTAGEYDIRATVDQTYNPSKTVTTKCSNAVDAIWNYVMLTSEYKLFMGFYRTNVSAHANACQHGGILSQDESRVLAQNGESWAEILHYFYDYGTYQSELSSGQIRIVNLSHSLTGSSYRHDIYNHWIFCTVCGCGHTKLSHSWTYNSTTGKYVCSVCKASYSSVPAAEVPDIAE